MQRFADSDARRTKATPGVCNSGRNGAPNQLEAGAPNTIWQLGVAYEGGGFTGTGKMNCRVILQ